MSKKSLILVILQLTCFGYFIFMGEMISRNNWIVMQVIGFIISVWGVVAMKIGNFNVQPEVKSTARFITNGPYKFIRNPMYTGIILFFGVSVITNFSYIHLAVFLLLVLVLLEKIKMEEIFLYDIFGEDYLKYKNETFRLIPFIY